jgi:hypothetical protein
MCLMPLLINYEDAGDAGGGDTKNKTVIQDGSFQR